jgi:hypothetical protein
MGGGQPTCRTGLQNRSRSRAKFAGGFVRYTHRDRDSLTTRFTFEITTCNSTRLAGLAVGTDKHQIDRAISERPLFVDPLSFVCRPLFGRHGLDLLIFKYRYYNKANGYDNQQNDTIVHCSPLPAAECVAAD